MHLPYCKPDEIPEEARLFRKFHLPEDLAKLVNTIHGIGCQHFLVASNGELVESIRYATVKLLEDEISVTKNIKETGKFTLHTRIFTSLTKIIQKDLFLIRILQSPLINFFIFYFFVVR